MPHLPAVARRGPAPSAAPEPVPTPRTTSAELLRGGQELQIVHGDLLYRLRLTALGKLILTK
jgi:hemin uptake protein HemP